MEEINNEEEISLIDLMAVLIRYRKFIAIFTLAVFVLGCAALSAPAFVRAKSTGGAKILLSSPTGFKPKMWKHRF